MVRSKAWTSFIGRGEKLYFQSGERPPREMESAFGRSILYSNGGAVFRLVEGRRQERLLDDDLIEQVVALSFTDPEGRE